MNSKAKYYELVEKLKAFEVQHGLVGKLHDEAVDRENSIDKDAADGVDYASMVDSLLESTAARLEDRGLDSEAFNNSL